MELEYYVNLIETRLESGTEPLGLIADWIRDGVQVVALGESHMPDTAFRRFGKPLLNDAKRMGVSRLCLELPPRLQTAFDDFSNDRDRQKLFNKMKAAGLDMGKFSASVLDPAPEQGYFDMLEEASLQGVPISLIDENIDEEGRCEYRDRTMCNNLAKYVQENERVLLWAGQKHVYRRRDRPTGKYCTATELLTQKDIKIASLLGCTESDKESDLKPVVVAALEANLQQSKAIKTDKYLNIPFAVEARCTSAACDRFRIYSPEFLRCQYCKMHNYPHQEDGLYFVGLSAFDAVAYFI